MDDFLMEIGAAIGRGFATEIDSMAAKSRDGNCDECRFFYTGTEEYPCNHCRHCYTSKFKPIDGDQDGRR